MVQPSRLPSIAVSGPLPIHLEPEDAEPDNRRQRASVGGRVPLRWGMGAATSASSAVSIEDFERLSAEAGLSGRRVELIRGEVRELPLGGYAHGHVTNTLSAHLTHWVWNDGFGVVLAAETGFRLDDPDPPPGGAGPVVRAPDVAWLAEPPAEAVPGFLTTAPDLVVETLSPSDAAGDVQEKILWWLARGVREAWVLDPANRTLTRHLADRSARILREEETLRTPELLPGFSLPLGKLFQRASASP